LTWSVVPLASARCRGAGIGHVCRANRNALKFYLKFKTE